MPVHFEVHSTTKRAIAGVLIAIALGALIVGVRKSQEPNVVAVPSSGALSIDLAGPTFIAPVALLLIEDASQERAWSAALALQLGARTEVPVANGRVDVLTEWYAIEVDRFDKWHEGIGQALHYGLATGKTPCLALMIETDKWPLNPPTTSKLRTIEQTALSKGVKLLLLRRLSPPA